MNLLERRIKAYGDARWPTRTVGGRWDKFVEEGRELGDSILSNDAPHVVAKEIADCAIVLSDMAQLMGMTLQECIALKVPILEQRLDNIRNGRPEKEEE